MSCYYKKAASYFIDALFPRRCPVCGDIVLPKGQLICRLCFKKLSFIKSPVCKKCGKEVVSDVMEYCFDCSRHKRSYDYGIALLNYNESAKNAMAGIKYKNKREYADFFVGASLHFCKEQLSDMKADAIIPVPVHPSRLRQRGYNQAELFADGLGAGLELPVLKDILLRNRKTDPQKTLSPAKRLKNLEKAFVVDVIPPGLSSVILVDDIYTTGSTAEACTRVLKRAGVKKVFNFSVCIGHGQ